MPDEELLSVPIRRKVVAPLPSAIRRGGEESPSRAWTPLGTLDGGAYAEVDRNGALHLRGRSWSMDWWVGAEDRWHFASAAASMRQSPMSGTPVVESLMRVPGGDIIHRVGGVAVGGTQGPVSAVKVEVENRSAVPVALALVLRPWTLDARGSLREVKADSHTVGVEGRDRLVFDRAPMRTAHGPTVAVGPALADGRDETPLDHYNGVDGDLEVAFVFPLAHTATLGTLVLASDAEADRSLFKRARRLLVRDQDGAEGDERVDPVPAQHELAKVVSGWTSHGEKDPSISMPIREWSELYTWSGAILRLAGTTVVTEALAGERLPAGVTAAERVVATSRELAGLDPTACDSITSALVGVQRHGGEVRMPDGSDATAALLFAAAGVLRAPWGPTPAAEEYIGGIAKAVDHLAKPAPQLGHLRARALTAVAPGLVRIGQPEVAEFALEVARQAEDEVRTGRAGRTETGTGPDSAAQAGEQSVAELRSALAEAELVSSGEEDGLRALAARINSRGASGVSDLTDGGGRPIGASGIDLAELAATRTALGEVAIVDGLAGPVILPSFPETWDSKPIEARGIATGWGEVSFALRWHDGTPVLLWEVEPWFGATPSGSAPVFRTGIDPGWIGVGWEGESYLDAWSTAVEGPA